jgi:hypothetical protein
VSATSTLIKPRTPSTNEMFNYFPVRRTGHDHQERISQSGIFDPSLLLARRIIGEMSLKIQRPRNNNSTASTYAHPLLGIMATANTHTGIQCTASRICLANPPSFYNAPSDQCNSCTFAGAGSTLQAHNAQFGLQPPHHPHLYTLGAVVGIGTGVRWTQSSASPFPLFC